MIDGLVRIEDAVMALNEDVAWLESEGAIGIDIVEMRNRVLEWLYELPTVPQKEYTEQQIRDTFNSGFSCGMEREWIDTEEEMPIDSQEVIASVYWTDYGDTILAYGHYNARFDNWKLYSDSEGELIKGYEVVAWMPLPYPYTADRKDEPTCSKMEQVDKDINVRSKDEPTPWCKYCQRRWENDCVGVAQCIRDMQMIAELYKASEDERQTERSE